MKKASEVALASRPALQQRPDLALQALARVLEPLAHLLISHGVQLPSAVEQLKQTLAQAASDFAVQGRANTDTRVALLTGVHRKDVRRLRAAEVLARSQALPIMSVASCVVARWISEPRYLNADNTARRLAQSPRHALPGEPVFSQLVAEVTRDVGARAVLDELQRLGVVLLEDDARVVLKAAAFIPPGGMQESFHFLGANVADHLATAVRNLDDAGGQGPWLEQSAFSEGLTAAQAKDLHAVARRLWGNALQEFLQKASVAEQRSQPPDEPRKRVRFGVYFFESAMPDAGIPAPLKGRAARSVKS
jgi:hypothetical protein